MAPLPWLVLLEQMAYQQLMKSPTFHRGVEQVVKMVHRARHGVPPDELGGTKLDDSHARFGQHFFEELKTQLGKVEKEQNTAKVIEAQKADQTTHTRATTTPAEDAESAWRDLQQQATQQPPPPPPPNQSFTSGYLDALRGQLQQQKKPPP